jgi:hypothetical protein
LENPKHILLVSYVFPPYYGIGGRRWAKHAAELTRLGYIIHVICAKNPFDQNSLWWDLIKNNPNIKLYQLPRMYPKVLVKFEHTFIQKILYKFWITVLPFITKGSYLDRTIFWKTVMLRKAKQLITEHQIKHVICTGGPFGVMYQITELRKWFNDIFILNDLRDPWTWGPNWGFPNLKGKRMAYELSLELKAIEYSDVFSVPSLDMSIYLKNQYPKFKDKITHIPHFFDPEEAVALPKTSSEKIRLIMYGNIYHNIEEYVTVLAQMMSKYKDAFILDIYTDKQHHKKTFQHYHAENVRFFQQVDAKELFKKFADYDYVLLFNPSYNVNNISTKFYEIISTKTPIILFCGKGLGSDFLVENNLGLHADLSTIDDLLNQLSNKTLDFKYDQDYNISQFSLANVTGSISDILSRSQSFNPSVVQKKPGKNILITFDYELFLGVRSGTVDNCIIRPTNQIIALLEKQKLTKALFFVDTTYLMRLAEREEKEAQEDYRKIKEQLSMLLKKGHIIFPHLHPHWLDATYLSDINQWELRNIDKYRFHNIDEATRNNLFDFSMSFIKKIQQEAQVFYAISGYRAGGWCLQPFTDFLPLFKKHHITNDFSVLKNFKNISPTVYYNYTKVPRRAIYRFNDAVETEEYNGPFKEYSISYIQIKNTFTNRLFLKYLSVRGIRNLGDGISVTKTEEQIIKDIDEGVKDNMIENYEMVSVELLKMTKMYAYKQLIHNNTYTHFISHPKMLSPHNVEYFDKLLTHIQKKYTIQTDFEKMN